MTSPNIPKELIDLICIGQASLLWIQNSDHTFGSTHANKGVLESSDKKITHLCQLDKLNRSNVKNSFLSNLYA